MSPLARFEPVTDGPVSTGLRATPAALRLIDRMRVDGELMFFVDPNLDVLCFGRGDLVLGPNDELLGTVRGCPVYVDRRRAGVLPLADATLDVERDLRGPHFVLRPQEAPAWSRQMTEELR